MRVIDLEHLGRPRVIACWEHDGVLIDPGPQSTEATLLAALGDERPRAILLTHIHFDHAGVTGALLRRWPELPVYVHERGARHIVDPERLVASTRRIYGVEGMRAKFGEVVPVPADSVRVLTGGETVLDEYRVQYTPGHASHHVAFLHEPSGTALAGDVAGIRIPPADYVLAPTPPPDVDVEAWERSLDVLAQWRPAALALAHFGRVDEVDAHLAGVRERLHEQALLAARHGEEAFVAGLRQRIEEHAGDVAAHYLQASPPDSNFAGLERWHRKRGEVSSRA